MADDKNDAIIRLARARMDEAPVETLRELLTLDADTGRLFWKERGAEWFRDTEGRNAAHACANWNARYAHSEAMTTIGAQGYRVGSIFNKKYAAHRIVFALVHGHWPEAEIDHVDGDRLNNRPGNLRNATRSQNQCNVGTMRSNTSGAKGVSWDRDREMWRADIMLHYKRKHLGMFKTVKDAADAYRNASAKMHQEFGRVA